MSAYVASETDLAARCAGTSPVRLDRTSVGALSMKWSGLHDAAAIVATIAGIEAPSMTIAIRNLPMILHDAGGWRRTRAEQAIDDLAALMEPGLAALLGACARGVDPRPAAAILWTEFVRARDALIAIAPPPGTHRRMM